MDTSKMLAFWEAMKAFALSAPIKAAVLVGAGFLLAKIL